MIYFFKEIDILLVYLFFLLRMERTLEWERKKKEKLKTKIMRMRFPADVIPELIKKGIAWYSCDYVLHNKKKLNETRWRTWNPTYGGA